MLIWLIAGLLIGAAAGSIVTWRLMGGRPSPPVAHLPAAPAEPSRPPQAAADDGVRQVLAANQRALADLEGRYQGRTQASAPEEAPKPARRRRPKPPATG